MTHRRLCVTFICGTMKQDPMQIRLPKKDCRFQSSDNACDEDCITTVDFTAIHPFNIQL